MSRHVLHFDRRMLRQRLTAGGVALGLEQGEVLASPGAPALPGRTVYIALQPHQRPGRVRARALYTQVVLEGPVLVRPQPHRGVGAELARDRPTAPATLRGVAPDPARYAAAVDAPLAELLGVSFVGGVPVAAVHVRPVRLNEAGGVDLVETLELDLQPVKARGRNRSAVLSMASRRAVRAHDWLAQRVLNPAQVPASAPRAGEDTPAPGGTGGAGGGTPAVGLDGAPLPGLAEVPAGAGPREVDYLVLTDNTTWDAVNITPGAAVPGMIEGFAPLLVHKRDRGLRAHVVTVTDVVNGVYGDHRTGARDLQEVLRRFLQAYVKSRGVEWLLLGGGTDIVPVRKACGSVAAGVFGAATTSGGLKVPKVGEYAWRDTFLALRLADDVATNPWQWGQPTHILTLLKTGTVVPHRTTASDSLCWFYCTDDTYSTASATPTPYARVNGEVATIQDEPQWYGPDNLIPADIYYSSLYGPQDLTPGRHDWDQLNNGLYGQWSRTTNLGGADVVPDLSVGRVPAVDATELGRFVSKLIAYETADQRPAEHSRFRKALFVAENWGGMVRLGEYGGAAAVPDGWCYRRIPGTDTTLLRAAEFVTLPAGNVYAYLNDVDRRELPYNDTGVGRGWCFARSGTDHTPSVTEISLFWTLIRIPIATEWILVRSTDAGELRPLHFVFDGGELDSSISDVELLRSELAVNRPRINDVQRLYSDEGDLSPSALAAAPIAHLTNDRLESELNEGQHLVVLSGHGNWPGCCGFDPWMAQRITNGGHTFIAYADSCLTAMYDEPGCLAAVLTAGVSQGAVAYIGNSRFSWIGVGCQLQRDFFARWSYTTHAGLMLDLTRTSWANSAYHRWAALALNLMGCPEMPIWRDDQDAAPYWVGNRRTLELHERRCPWVGRMSTSNMRRFASAEQGLAAGYDGCGFCMREHHHR